MSREEILSRIQRALGRGPLPATTRNEVLRRLDSPTPNLKPKRADLDPEHQVKLFLELAEGLGVTSERLTDIDAVPRALAI